MVRSDPDVALTPTSPPDAAAREEPRETLLARGLWPAFRARPFGDIPLPDALPRAIVVNAVHGEPQAPDPSVVLSDRRDAFRLGLEILTRLTPGAIHLCQSPGPPLAPDTSRIVHSSFAGTRAAGFDGTLIDRLCPIVGAGEVWSIGYQDVIAIGHLFETGAYLSERIVSVSGPAAGNPRLIRTRLGARLADLGADPGGLAPSDHPYARFDAAYLGRYETQARLGEGPRQMALSPAVRKAAGRPLPMIPTRALETALAIDIPTVPLLRALSVGDAETAARLGCLALVEEDVSALSHRCTSGADYGVLLRHVLDDLRVVAA